MKSGSSSDALREQLWLIIKGCACTPGNCPMCQLNRQEAMKALEYLEGFELMLVCKHCGGIAEPGDHVCGDGD